jgi:hypothetical protein
MARWAGSPLTCDPSGHPAVAPWRRRGSAVPRSVKAPCSRSPATPPSGNASSRTWVTTAGRASGKRCGVSGSSHPRLHHGRDRGPPRCGVRPLRHEPGRLAGGERDLPPGAAAPEDPRLPRQVREPQPRLTGLRMPGRQRHVQRVGEQRYTREPRGSRAVGACAAGDTARSTSRADSRSYASPASASRTRTPRHGWALRSGLPRSRSVRRIRSFLTSHLSHSATGRNPSVRPETARGRGAPARDGSGLVPRR